MSSAPVAREFEEPAEEQQILVKVKLVKHALCADLDQQ